MNLLSHSCLKCFKMSFISFLKNIHYNIIKSCFDDMNKDSGRECNTI